MKTKKKILIILGTVVAILIVLFLISLHLGSVNYFPGLLYIFSLLVTLGLVPIVVVTLLVIGIIQDTKIKYSKGNISNYEIKNFSLIWKDKVEGEDTESRIKRRFPIFISRLMFGSGQVPCKTRRDILNNLKRSGLLLLTIILIFVIVDLLDIQTTSMTLMFVFFFVFLTSIIAAIFLSFWFLILLFKFIVTYKYKLDEPLPTAELHVYREGLKYRNHFFEWSCIKYLDFPLGLRISTAITNIASSFSRRVYPISTSTLKIVDKSNKVYLVEILDKEGLRVTLEKINKGDLLMD